MAKVVGCVGRTTARAKRRWVGTFLASTTGAPGRCSPRFIRCTELLHTEVELLRHAGRGAGRRGGAGITTTSACPAHGTACKMGSRKLGDQDLGADELRAVVAHLASSQLTMNLIDRYRLHDLPPGFDPESRSGFASARSTPIR